MKSKTHVMKTNKCEFVDTPSGGIVHRDKNSFNRHERRINEGINKKGDKGITLGSGAIIVENSCWKTDSQRAAEYDIQSQCRGERIPMSLSSLERGMETAPIWKRGK